MSDRFLLAAAKRSDRIPEAVLRGFFTCAADIAWVFRVGGVRQLERNLTHVFASEMRRSHGSVDNRELRRRVRHCSRQGMRSYFAYFCEAMTVGARSEQQLRARIRGDGQRIRFHRSRCKARRIVAHRDGASRQLGLRGVLGATRGRPGGDGRRKTRQRRIAPHLR